MASTNKTTVLELSQFVGNDIPGWLTDYNSDMSKIDAFSSSVNSNVSNAVQTANSANASAQAASTAANSATSLASSAKNSVDNIETGLQSWVSSTSKTSLNASLTLSNFSVLYNKTLGLAYITLEGYFNSGTINNGDTLLILDPIIGISTGLIKTSKMFAYTNSNGTDGKVYLIDYQITANGAIKITSNVPSDARNISLRGMLSFAGAGDSWPPVS